ncbi:MAG: ribosome biogenesis GTP-binding protein YihA/YsxC [Gemmatimonadetes bacterium]|nr:ribosome biogenesis GTP-binding protein YihA/YsxC [Gemmatimonadota bacterium]
MKILDVTFAGAIAQAGARTPAALPQIAFAGRSNVGKSSLINRLLGRTRHPIARVSATPGKTQEINFYRVRAASRTGHGVEFLLVDLPGYGYARTPVAVRARWGPLIEAYLRNSEALCGVVQLVDSRHPPTAHDRQMLEFLAELQVPTVIALTKADKLSSSAAATRAPDLAASLGLPDEQVITFSAKTGAGRDSLLDALEALLLNEGGPG